MTLFFLSANDVVFTERCDDPWFAAQSKGWTIPDSFNKSAVVYLRDEPARVLGCAERYQFCNPGSETSGSCTPLAGIYPASMAANATWQTVEQREFFNASSNQIFHADGLLEIVTVAGISSLTAREVLQAGRQGPLPSHQWQLEVENWFGATLADLQRVMVEYVTGPTDPAMFPLMERTMTENARRVCRSLVSSHSPFTFLL